MAKKAKIWRNDRLVGQPKNSQAGRLCESLAKSYTKYGVQDVRAEDLRRSMGDGGSRAFCGGQNLSKKDNDHGIKQYDGSSSVAGKVERTPKGGLKLKVNTNGPVSERTQRQKDVDAAAQDEALIAAYCKKHSISRTTPPRVARRLA